MIKMSVSERVEKYKENFIIQDCDQEYYLEKYCELQAQYDNTEPEKVKTRYELLNMMTSLSRQLKFEVKNKVEYKDYKVLVVTEDNNKMLDLYNIIEKLINKNDIKHKNISKNYIELYLFNGMTILFRNRSKTTDSIRGTRVNQYINLTDDIKFENEILKPMLKMGFNK
jgi:hypothetical protein